MKRLVLMRHGKSSWEYDVNDVERPLKSRGVKDATLVSQAFKNHEFRIDKIYSSPANRALSTCKIFINTTEKPYSSIEVVDNLYDFSGHSVIEFVKNLDDAIKNVMIFGHNHAFTSISNIFGSKFIDNLPTAGMVVLAFDVDSWKMIEKGTTELTLFPRDLKNK